MSIKDDVFSSSVSFFQNLWHNMVISLLNKLAPLADGEWEWWPNPLSLKPQTPAHRSAVASLDGPAGIQARPSGISTFASADGVSLQRRPAISPSGHTGAVPATATKPENQRKDHDQSRSGKAEVKYQEGKREIETLERLAWETRKQQCLSRVISYGKMGWKDL